MNTKSLHGKNRKSRLAKIGRSQGVVEPRLVRFSKWAKKRSLFQLLSAAGAILAIIGFGIQIKEQRLARAYKAWAVITSAEGKESSAGRIQALEDLNGMGVSLAGVDLRGAMLEGVDLREVDLRGAKLDSSDLDDALFQYADLRSAFLRRASLISAQLQGAILWGAQLQGAKLREANLQDARLWFAHLEDADLKGAHLEGADLSNARLEGSKNWWLTSTIAPINLYESKGTPYGFESESGFMAWAESNGAVYMANDEWLAYRDSVMASKSKQKPPSKQRRSQPRQ